MNEPPNALQKPDLLSWLEQYLPFKIPRLPFAQTAKNLDKAAAMLVAAGGEHLVAKVNASTARVDARSNAEVVLIQYGAEQIGTGDAALALRARNYAIGDALNRQSNREEILKLAAEDIKAEPPTEDAKYEIEDDWLNLFSSFAEKKSAHDIQQMWARILTAEIRRPGSISLRTLQFMSTINSADANRIVKLFTFAIDGSFIPKTISDNNYCKYDDLIFLQQVNLISGLYGAGGHDLQISWTHSTKPMRVTTFAYHQHQVTYEIAADETTSRVGALILTDIGRELFCISDAVAPNMPFYEWFTLQSKPPGTTKVTLLGPSRDGFPKTIFEAPLTPN